MRPIVRLHTFQLYDWLLEASPIRYDVAILRDLVEMFLAAEHKVEVLAVLPVEGHGGRYAKLLGVELTGVIHDALVLEVHNGFFVIDYQDCEEGPGLALAGADGWRGSFLCQFYRHRVVERFGDRAYKVYPGFFCDYYPYETPKYRDEVQEFRSDWAALDDRLFFAGSFGYGARDVAEVLRAQYPEEVNILAGRSLERDEFFRQSAQHKYCLTLAGGGPYCFRDFEYASLGIPVIAPVQSAELLAPFVPGFHYAAAWPDAPGPESIAKAIIERHRIALQEGGRAALWRASMAQAHYRHHYTPRAIAAQIYQIHQYLDEEKV